MSDDRNNEPVQSDFDDWLAAEDSPPVDPVAGIEELDEPDEPDEEVVEDVAVDEDGGDDPEPVTEEVPVVESDVSEDTGELPAVEEEFDPDAITEIPVVTAEAPVAEAPMVEFEAFDGGHGDITGELEIIVPEVPEVAEASEAAEASETPEASEASEAHVLEVADVDDTDLTPLGDPPFDFQAEEAQGSAFDPFDDTGEAVFVTGESAIVAGPASGVSFAELWGVEVADEGEEEPTPPVEFDQEPVVAPPPPPPPAEPVLDDDFVLGADDIRYGATREHADLAAAIAAADSEDTEQVALSAALPGLDSGVVGFDDVVEAEGMRRERARASGDLISRVITGLVLVGALVASLFWRPALLLLAAGVFVLGAGEFYTALMRHDRKPVALFGFVGIVAACAGAFFWSAAAIPIAFILATILLLLFYAVSPGKPDPMGNLALTTSVMIWAGLGAFAMLIAKSEDYRVLIAGVVVVVAATDIAAFFVGRSIGRTKFAPWVSPNKTVEGLVAGVIVAVGLGAVLHFFPPFELTSGLAIGAAAAVLTPLGDLAMSAAKRALGLKDMGSVLPGHGGFLDRIDGLLFVIPAAWAIFIWAGLL